MKNVKSTPVRKATSPVEEEDIEGTKVLTTTATLAQPGLAVASKGEGQPTAVLSSHIVGIPLHLHGAVAFAQVRPHLHLEKERFRYDLI